MTDTHDTAAALWSAIDAYGCDAASHGALGKDATTREALDRAITAHVEAEVARRLAAAPEVEAAIDAHAGAEVEHDRAVARNARGSGPLAAPAERAAVGVALASLRAAFAADKARAVEAARISIGTVRDLDDIVACRIAALGEPRWRRLLERRASPTPPAAPRSPASTRGTP